MEKAIANLRRGLLKTLSTSTGGFGSTRGSVLDRFPARAVGVGKADHLAIEHLVLSIPTDPLCFCSHAIGRGIGSAPMNH